MSNIESGKDDPVRMLQETAAPGSTPPAILEPIDTQPVTSLTRSIPNLEDIERGNQAGEESRIALSWQRYRVVFVHTIIWVLSTSYIDDQRHE